MSHRASVEGSIKDMVDATPTEPASMQDLSGGIEGAKQHTVESMAAASEQINSLAGTVKNETDGLSSQVLTLRV